MAKKIIYLALCAVMFISAIGCGKKGPPMPPDEARSFSQGAER